MGTLALRGVWNDAVEHGLIRLPGSPDNGLCPPIEFRRRA
jgi:hypothetical protein